MLRGGEGKRVNYRNNMGIGQSMQEHEKKHKKELSVCPFLPDISIGPGHTLCIQATCKFILGNLVKQVSNIHVSQYAFILPSNRRRRRRCPWLAPTKHILTYSGNQLR